MKYWGGTIQLGEKGPEPIRKRENEKRNAKNLARRIGTAATFLSKSEILRPQSPPRVSSRIKGANFL